MRILSQAKKFVQKYPLTIAWRIKQNSSIVEKYINPDEKPIYVFTGQMSESSLDIFSTAIVVLTDKRIIIGRKRVIFGYFFYSIMPQMFNDLNVKANLIWGKVYIDTVKELVTISNIDKKALDEIETNISTYMMNLKKEYPSKEE